MFVACACEVYMGCVTVHECECVCRGRSLGPRGHSFGILLSAPEGTNPLPSCWVPTDKALVAPKRSKSHTPLARQLHRAQQPSRLCHRLGRDEPPERPRPPFPHRPPPPGSRGRADGGCRPSCLLPAPAAAASVPGRRRRRLERVAGPDGGVAGALETPPCGNPARGLCVLSNYLFIEKKGGEKKKKSHVRVIRMRREAAEGGKN